MLKQSKSERKVKSFLANVHQIRQFKDRAQRMTIKKRSLIKKFDKSSTYNRNMMQIHINRPLTLSSSPIGLVLQLIEGAQVRF